MAFLALCIASNFLLSQADNWGGVESTAAKDTGLSFSSAILHLKHAWLFGGVMEDENHQPYNPQLRCFDIEKEQLKDVVPKNSPKGRHGHSAIVTPSGQMWIYGGARINLETGVNELATELVYIGLKEGATSESWSQVQPEKKPKNRLFHTAVYYEGFMWIFGGVTKAAPGSAADNDFVNDVHAFDIEAHTWSEISCEGQKPAPRQGHSAVIGADGRMWVYGGNALRSGPDGLDAFLKELHVLDLNKKSWSKVETAGFLPGFLFHHASVMDAAGRLWLVGGVAAHQQGYSGNAYFLDTTLADDSWHGVPEFNDTANPDAPPLDKMASRAIIESSGKIWVFGGIRWRGHASKKDWSIYWLDSNAPKPTSSTTSMSPSSGAAIMEEAWMALDVDMDGYIPKASLGLWQSQDLMSSSAAKYLNSSKAADGMISNDGYIETLLEADHGALGDEKWVSGAWLLCDKNQDQKVTKIEMGFLQRHGGLKKSIDQQLWTKDADGDGALSRDEFNAGLATVALNAEGAIQQIFHEVQTRYWPVAKRSFCCQSQGVCGLNVFPSAITESTTFGASYDCTTGANINVEGWTEMHRAWCCSRQSVGCFSSISVPYDCEEGRDHIEARWSSKKQEWCCFYVGKGCLEPNVDLGGHPDFDHVHYVNHIVHTDDGMIVHSPFGAPEATQVTHVVHHPDPSLGKPVLVRDRVHVYDVVHKATHEVVPFDCREGFSNWKVGWSGDKKSWCCAHFSRGCQEEHSEAKYDCMAGYSNWRSGWSLDKKSWCCDKEQRGCV